MPDSVEVHLKPVLTAAERRVPSKHILSQEYAFRLLEQYGATKTPQNVTKILRELPIEKALVLPVWARGSVLIFPGCDNYKESDKQELMEQMFRPKDDETVKRKGGRLSDSPVQKPEEQRPKEKKGPLRSHSTRRKSIRGGEDAPPATQKGRRVSWSTVHTLDVTSPAHGLLTANDLQSKEFLNILEPPGFDEADVETSVSLFCASLSDYCPRMKQDLTGRLFASVKTLLCSTLSVRLYGLLCHFCYWNVLRPWVRNVLQGVSVAESLEHGGAKPSLQSAARLSRAEQEEEEEEDRDNRSVASSLEDEMSAASDGASLAGRDREQLFVQLEACLVQLHKRMGFDAAALATAHQAHVCACHFVVDELLSMGYKWLASEEKEEKKKKKKGEEEDDEDGSKSASREKSVLAQQTSLRLRRLVHQTLADLIDPGRIFTQHMLISSYVGEHKRVAANNPAAKYFTTSLAVRSVFGDASSDRTRRFLRHASQPYAPVPGVARVSGDGPDGGEREWGAAHSKDEPSFKVTKAKLPVLSSTNASTSTLVESPPRPGRAGLGVPLSIPSTVPSATALPPPKMLAFSSKRSTSQPQGQTQTQGQRFDRTLARSSSARQALDEDSSARRLADELARSWERDDRNPLIDAAARALRDEQQRRDDEAKAALALERHQAQRGPVDWYRLFPEDEAGPSIRAAPKPGLCPDDLVASIHTMHLAGPSFPVRGDDDSASQSMINNPRAPLRVSVRGKGELMGLVASRTAAQYQHVKSDPRAKLILNPF